MTRGRRPERTLKRALEIAENRGTVQPYQQGPGMICNFTIYLAGCLAQVRIKRVRHLRCSLQWLEREAAEELAGLRLIASSGEISRELWICAPNSSFRFFRICDTSLAELDRDGRPLPAQSPVPVPRPARTGARKIPATAAQPGADPGTGIPALRAVTEMTSPSENHSPGDPGEG
ncbi:MAG: hypothetical protein Q8R70_03285 [Methanoregula sp.]|nr:hypothetical protein [Methanoregula sp.]